MNDKKAKYGSSILNEIPLCFVAVTGYQAVGNWINTKNPWYLDLCGA